MTARSSLTTEVSAIQVRSHADAHLAITKRHLTMKELYVVSASSQRCVRVGIPLAMEQSNVLLQEQDYVNETKLTAR